MPHLIKPLSSDANRVPKSGNAWLVTCLCAAWCGTCNDYEDTISNAAELLRESIPDVKFAWVDIEDDSDWLGEIDVENFPTVMITSHSDGGDKLHFFGTILPQAEHLARLVRNVVEKNAAINAPAADQLFAAAQISAFFRAEVD